MRIVVAKLLTEDGRPKKLLIPPNTTRGCPVVCTAHPFYTQPVRFELYITPDLARRSLFLIQTCPPEAVVDFEPLIYNGGWENQWIEHGQEIVNIYEFRN